MELIELIFIEETDKHYFFNIVVEEGLFSSKTMYECVREKDSMWSRFISNGDNLFHTWTNMDYIINAILEKENKSYKKEENVS